MNKKNLSATLAGTIVVSLALAPVVHAAEDLFAMKAAAASTLVAEASDKTQEGKYDEDSAAPAR